MEDRPFVVSDSLKCVSSDSDSSESLSNHESQFSDSRLDLGMQLVPFRGLLVGMSDSTQQRLRQVLADEL